MIIIDKKDYDACVRINGRDIKCYSKNKIKELYPNGNYKIVGETFEKNKKRNKDIIEIANKKLNVSKYGSNSKILYKTKGYIEVDENQYIVYLKSRVAFLFLLFLIFIGIGVSTYIGIKTFTTVPTILPDYQLPPEDDQTTVIDGDNTKKSVSKNGGGSVRVRLGSTAKVDLKTGEIEMIYQNPNQSNQDSVISLVLISDNKEYTIARSGLIKSGNQITKLKLMNNEIKLSKGVYKGKYIIDHYNPETGEKSLTNSNFNDIEIQVNE